MKKLKVLFEDNPKYEIVWDGNKNTIIKIIENYLSHHADVDKFTSSSLKGFLIINDILKNEQNQLLILSEILIFLSSISSRKDYYLEKVGELENSLCEAFFQIIEKYIFIDNDAINQSRSMIQDKSGLGTSLYVNKSDKDKANLIQIIKDSEAKISSLKQYIESLEKTKEHLEFTDYPEPIGSWVILKDEE